MVDSRDLAAMIRSGEVPGAAWVKALDAERKLNPEVLAPTVS